MLKLINKHRQFGGSLEYYRHGSEVNHSTMSFAIFLPPQAETQKVPVLYWLSGLTCTEDNFMSKTGAQRVTAQLGIALVAMDTSSRDNAIEGEDDSYDFGSGASFYLNATTEAWSKNYNAVCKIHNHPLTLRMQEGYDHSYFFISTFIADHLRHHAEYLSA